VSLAALRRAVVRADRLASPSIEAALRNHSSGGGSVGAPLFPGTGHTLSGAPAPGGGEGFGYLKVIVIVGLLWIWYTYSKGGEDSIPSI
jgi:hypothetical protein